MNEKLHYCTAYNGVDCSGQWGSAADYCQESESGQLWIGNGEYSNCVNYCPFCGYKAIKQMESK